MSQLLLTILRCSFDPATIDEAVLDQLHNASEAQWREAIESSFNHAVDALAVDGYHNCLAVSPNLITALDSDALETDRYDWFGSVLQSEYEYNHHWKASCKMAQCFWDSGITTYNLKGFCISRFYPVPEHRRFCDIDVFLSDYEKGNELMEQEGVTVDRSFYKHSAFRYHGLMVENHCFCSPVRGNRRRKDYEIFLRSIIADGAEKIMDSHIVCPSPLFNALFLTSHAQIHYLMEGGIVLRHICDWAVLLKAYKDTPIWGSFVENCHRFGFLKFAYVMSRAAHNLLGVEIPFDCPEDAVSDKKFLDSILCLNYKKPTKHGPFLSRLQLVGNMISSNWKYKLFSDRSMIVELCSDVWAFFFERSPKLKK